MFPDLKTLRNLVRQLAQEELLPRFDARHPWRTPTGRAAHVPSYSGQDGADVQHHTKLDGSVVTEADIALQQRLQQELARHWPEYDFLGEEMAGHEHEERMRVCTQKGLWCLDPLDGTSNFAAGVPYFAVSLALLIHCRPELGLVYDPVRDECFMAQRGKGAWLNGLSLGTHAALELPLQRCIAAVDFKRLAAPLAARLGASPPYGSQRNFGASSLDWCWLADGRFHVYLHGGQKLWDYAAGHLILAEAGGRSQTLTGAEVFAFGLDARSVVAARDSRLFAAWQAWVSEHDNAIAAS